MEEKAFRAFVELSGDLLEDHGLPHMAGRVVGVLLACVPPHRTMDELADQLQASKGAISMATQALTRLGLVEKLSLPGERRRHYRIREGLWAELFRSRKDHLLRHQEMLDLGLEALADEPASAKMRLLEFQAFMDFVHEELPALSARWEERSGEYIRRRTEETTTGRTT